MRVNTLTESPIWNDVRTVADEVRLQIHLASMEARQRWQALEPRLGDLERVIAREGDRAAKTISHDLGELTAALRRLRDDITRSDCCP